MDAPMSSMMQHCIPGSLEAMVPGLLSGHSRTRKRPLAKHDKDQECPDLDNDTF